MPRDGTSRHDFPNDPNDASRTLRAQLCFFFSVFLPLLSACVELIFRIGRADILTIEGKIVIFEIFERTLFRPSKYPVFCKLVITTDG